MVSDSKDITPRTIRAHNIADDAITIAKVGKKIIHKEAADPTAASDAGTGFEVGSLWNNTSSGEIFICANSSEEDANWKGQEGENVNDPFVLQGTNYGWTSGGVADYFPGGAGVNFITQWAFASDIGSGTDWGDLVTNHNGANVGSSRSTTESFVIGGYVPHGAGFIDTISKYVFASPGNATDVGEWIAGALQDSGSAPDGTNTFIMGGTGPPPGGGPQINATTVTKMSMTSPYPQSDNGELSAGKYGPQGASDVSYAYSSGGKEPSQVTTIERMAFATTSGTFTDVGELTAPQSSGGSCSGPTHALTGGGYPFLSNMERYEFASSSNGADVGETSHLGQTAGSNGPAYGYFVGGAVPGQPPGGQNTTNNSTRMAWTSTSGGSTDCGELGGDNYSPIGVRSAIGSEN